MRKIRLIIVVLLTVSIANALAQKGQEEGREKGHRMEKLKSELNLTDAQVTEMKLVFREAKKDIRGIKSNESIPREEKRSQIKSVKDKSDVKIGSILDQEQFSKFEELKERRKEESRSRRQAEKKKEKVKLQRDLADEQVKKILTEEQYQALKVKRKEMRAERKERREK